MEAVDQRTHAACLAHHLCRIICIDCCMISHMSTLSSMPSGRVKGPAPLSMQITPTALQAHLCAVTSLDLRSRTMFSKPLRSMTCFLLSSETKNGSGGSMNVGGEEGGSRQH